MGGLRQVTPITGVAFQLHMGACSLPGPFQNFSQCFIMSYQPLTDARQSGTIAALKLGVAVGAGLGFVVYLISGTDATSNLFSASAVKAVQAAPVTQVANIHGQPVYQTGSATTSFSAGTPAASVRLGAYETGSNVIVGSAPMTSQVRHGQTEASQYQNISTWLPRPI